MPDTKKDYQSGRKHTEKNTKGPELTKENIRDLISKDSDLHDNIEDAVLLNREDRPTETGYVWNYRIHVPYMNLNLEPQEMFLETLTYFEVTLSKLRDRESNLSVYRIVRDVSRKGEDLTTVLAMIASIKDAFHHTNKVQLNGLLEEHEINFIGLKIKTDPFLVLQSVKMVRE